MSGAIVADRTRRHVPHWPHKARLPHRAPVACQTVESVGGTEMSEAPDIFQFGDVLVRPAQWLLAEQGSDVRKIELETGVD